MSFLDAQHEPLRRYVYGVGAALVAVAVIVGVLTSEQAVAFTAVLGAALLVPAVEVARSKVDSPATVAEKVADAETASYVYPAEAEPLA